MLLSPTENSWKHFERYYDEEIVMQENSSPPVRGKAANRKRELEFLANVTEFRDATITGLAVSGNTPFVVWRYDYTHKEWGVRNYTQVSVQRRSFICQAFPMLYGIIIKPRL